MRQRKYAKQAGFSIVEALVIIMGIVIVGTAGFVVYQHNRPKVSEAAQSDTQTNNTKPATDTDPKPVVAYLEIKEWGVRLPLTDAIKDAYYVLSVSSAGTDGVPDQVHLGLRSLDSSGCSAEGSNQGQDSALATIFRVKPGYVDPVSNKPTTQEHPNGVTIGDYYYVVLGRPNTSLSTCKAPQAALESADAAFSAVQRGIDAVTE